MGLFPRLVLSRKDRFSSLQQPADRSRTNKIAGVLSVIKPRFGVKKQAASVPQDQRVDPPVGKARVGRQKMCILLNEPRRSRVHNRGVGWSLIAIQALHKVGGRRSNSGIGSRWSKRPSADQQRRQMKSE